MDAHAYSYPNYIGYTCDTGHVLLLKDICSYYNQKMLTFGISLEFN